MISKLFLQPNNITRTNDLTKSDQLLVSQVFLIMRVRQNVSLMMFVNDKSQQNFSYQRISIYLKGVVASVCRPIRWYLTKSISRSIDRHTFEEKVGMLSMNKIFFFFFDKSVNRRFEK